MSTAVVELAAALISLHSPSSGERAVADRCGEELRELGFRVSVDDDGNVLAEVGEGSPRLLFDGHIDTVAANPNWSRDPLEPALEDNWLYGLGSVDMKGPIAAMILGVADAAAGGKIAGTVGVSLSTLEEVLEGATLASVVRRFQPDAVIIAEPSDLRLMLGQRGRAEITVDLRGIAAHAAFPERGVNALDAAAAFLCALGDRDEPTDPVLGRGILVATEAVTEPMPGVSVVPSRARLRLDRRTLPGESAAAVLAELTPALDAARAVGAHASATISAGELTTYTGRRLQGERFLPAWQTPADGSLAQAAQRALSATLGAVEVSHYGFCTNGSLTAGQLGIPTIGFGPGDPQQAHQADEHIAVDDLECGRIGFSALAAIQPEVIP
jgi:putative selenium metabolism hydrolase